MPPLYGHWGCVGEVVVRGCVMEGWKAGRLEL